MCGAVCGLELSLRSLYLLMNATAAHKNEMVLPVPVGDSSIAFWPERKASITLAM